MYFKAGKNDKICANPVSDTLDGGLTDNFSVGWSCLRFVCVGRERECWQDVIGTITAPMAYSREPRDDFNPGISEYITELSQQQPTAETAPSTSEMQFHPLNLSEQGLTQEWEDRLYLRFDSEPYSSDYNAATGRLGHARTNFLQWHFNRQFLFATQICSKATW